MKIRNRITLWITGAGLLAGLIFSVIISYELLEQPFELLDEELDNKAHTLLAGLGSTNGMANANPMAITDYAGELYWFKIFNQRQELVCSSAITDHVDLPLKKNRKRYNVSVTIPPDITVLEQDDIKEATFRVRVFTIPFSGHNYMVQIARPMEKLQEEIVELAVSITIGLIVYTIAIMLSGYFVAGKILKPIAHINTLAREISEKTLNKRIPLGTNQDELYILSSSLNQMFDRLQFSFHKQKEFIANASHELKTPIAMQRLFFSEALQRNDLPDDFQIRLTDQSAILFRMERLVKNLLDLSALELRETFTPKLVYLPRIISTVLAEFKEIIQTAEINLVVDIEKEFSVYGDKEKLRRMFINLIDNAIKYNKRKNGEIRIALKGSPEQILIKIYNTGPGIPESELTKVFNQFYRLEKSRSSAFGGSGLGLTIVEQIVELHHGRIEIESKYGSWVSITIMLPSSPQNL